MHRSPNQALDITTSAPEREKARKRERFRAFRAVRFLAAGRAASAGLTRIPVRLKLLFVERLHADFLHPVVEGHPALAQGDARELPLAGVLGALEAEIHSLLAGAGFRQAIQRAGYVVAAAAAAGRGGKTGQDRLELPVSGEFRPFLGFQRRHSAVISQEAEQP